MSGRRAAASTRRPAGATLAILLLVGAPALAQEGPSPEASGWALPVPNAAIKVEEHGGEALFRDARSAKRVVAFYRKAFSGLPGATCIAPRGDGEPLLRCARTVPVEGDTVEDLTVEVRVGAVATEIRTRRAFRVGGRVHLPPKLVLPRQRVRYQPLDPLAR